MSVRVFAPAKINLTLQVGRPRADGMHPLQSAVMFADVGDWIEAAPAASLSLSVAGPFASALTREPDNIVLRAARALAEAAGVTKGAALALEKLLPVASGVGGGSSDAAATLKALNTLWNLGLSDDALTVVARRLGADVAVCVLARPAWMTGVGDAVTPMRAPQLHAVLVNPLEPLATVAVFREFDRMGLGGAFTAIAAPLWRSLDDVVQAAGEMGNDLLAPACALMSEVSVILNVLRQDSRVAYAGLSGSGATCYALVESAAASASLAADVAARRPDWWVCAAKLGAT